MDDCGPARTNSLAGDGFFSSRQCRPSVDPAGSYGNDRQIGKDGLRRYRLALFVPGENRNPGGPPGRGAATEPATRQLSVRGLGRDGVVFHCFALPPLSLSEKVKEEVKRNKPNPPAFFLIVETCPSRGEDYGVKAYSKEAISSGDSPVQAWMEGTSIPCFLRLAAMMRLAS